MVLTRLGDNHVSWVLLSCGLGFGRRHLDVVLDGVELVRDGFGLDGFVLDGRDRLGVKLDSLSTAPLRMASETRHGLILRLFATKRATGIQVS